MTVDLYRSSAQPLSRDMLFHWHRILLGSRRDMGDVGHYRTSNEAMQIVFRSRSSAQSAL